MEANALYQSAKKRVGNALSGIKARPKNALIDATRGALMGVTTDILGYPVDVASMAMQPFGYSVEKPVGGSDWLAERLTSPTGSAAETAGRFASGFLTPGPDDMMRMAGLVKPKATVNELITYHGSPHRINNVDEANPMGKFDLSKVGAGQGSQAYGHGIYLAETSKVAKTYRTMGLSPTVGIKPPLDARQTAKQIADAAMTRNDYDMSKAILELQDYAKKSKGDMLPLKISGAIRSISSGEATGVGHLYTVDLPDEHIAKMLDWDKPLSEQPENIRILAKDLGLIDEASEDGIYRKMRAFGADDKTAREYAKKQAYEPTGAHVYSALETSFRDGRIARNEAGTGLVDSQRAASEHLKAFGIPGIKYLDGGSRGAGEGTRNFVIFDGDTAKILKRE
jgi:hypothetical protein